jgi:hypothetical protein
MDEHKDLVRENTHGDANLELDRQRLADVARFVGAPPADVRRRLQELDREWDVERALEANASTIMLLSLGLSALHSRRWLALSAVVPTFLLQHALQGWCPPIEVFRRLGLRTRREIDAERMALKALRRDFDGVGAASGDATTLASRALAAAEQR